MALTFRDNNGAPLSYDEMDSNWRFFTGSFINTGTITAENFTSNGNVSASGDINASNFSTVGNITASGNVSASGEVFGDIMNANSLIKLGGDNIRMAYNTPTDNLRVYGGGFEVGNTNDLILTETGNITASGDISSSADVYGVTGSFLHLEGDGSQLTGVTSEWDGTLNGNGEITGSLVVTGNITGSNISSSGILYGNSLNLEGANISYDSSNDILYFADSVKLGLGSGPALAIPDIAISHDGANGLIKNVTGDLTIESSTSNTSIRNFALGGNIILQSDKSPGGQGGVVLISGSNDDVRLDIRGNVTASGNISASGHISALSASIGNGDFNVNIHNTSRSTAIGYNSLISQTITERYNTGVGAFSLRDTTTGLYNTAIGYGTLVRNLTGQNNVAIGHNTMNYSSGSLANSNTAVGYNAIYHQRNPFQNVAIGLNSLRGTTPSSGIVTENTAVGVSSGQSLNSGSQNTFIGKDAGKLIGSATASNNNTCVGHGAVIDMTVGNNNTYIGASITPSSNTGGIFDEVVLGYAAEGEGNTSVRIGNTSITSAHVEVDWTITSDSRVKKNIQSGSLGLDFINKLNPVRFQKVNPAEYPSEILELRYKERTEIVTDPETNVTSSITIPPDPTPSIDNKWYDGLIAQEVSSSLSELESTSDIWYESPVNGKQGVKYSTLTIPLIKAVQELSARVIQLESYITGSI